MRYAGISCWLLLFALVSGPKDQAQVNVTTFHNDDGRTGLNARETVLNPGNTDANNFGKICSAAVDGQIYAQPLVVTNVTIKNQLYSSVVYIVTQNDSVYAFDGESSSPTCTQLLHRSLLETGESAVDCHYIGGQKCQTISPTIGVISTPVVDTTSNTIFLIAESQVGNPPTAWIHRIHALDIASFHEKFNGPVPVAGSVNTGLRFDSQTHIQRSGLLLLPGTNGSPAMVYGGFSLMDGSPRPLPNGWIFGYQAQNLRASGFPLVFSTTPARTAWGGGIWQGGGGLAAGIDSVGGGTYIYFASGDGTFDASTGGADYGDSFVKLTPDLSTVAGFFTPYNQACLAKNDQDFGAAGVILIPNGTIPSNPYLAVVAGKEGAIYAVDRGSPGGYGGHSNCTGTNSNTEVISGLAPFHSPPAYFDRNLYYAPLQAAAPNGFLSRYRMDTSCSPGPICAAPAASTQINFPYGTSPSVSVNGNNLDTAIVWAIWGEKEVTGGDPAVLYAFSALTLAPLFASNSCGTQDLPGPATKFSVPSVANGRVYIGTQTDFDIYGELARPRTCP